MNPRWSGIATLALFFIITIIGFVVWTVLLAVLWFGLRAVGYTTDPWAMISALSTAIAAAAVFSAGFIGYRELSEAASTRHIEVADHLFEELNSPENIAARRWIYANLPADPVEGIRTMPEEGRDAVKQVLNSLDHVAFMTQAGWIPDDIIMPWMHPMIMKSWVKIEPYVQYERRRRKEPYYYQKIDELARRCATWRRKHLGEEDIQWVDDAI
jgi:hypothetical protein